MNREPEFLVRHSIKKFNLQWKTEESNNETLLFYFFPEYSAERIATFKEKLSRVNFKKCITNLDVDLGDNVISVSTKDWYLLQKELCDFIYPLSRAPIIAITGTNGKTTTTDILRQLFVKKEKKVLTIGTLGVWWNEKKISDFNLTTPHYIDFRKTISNYDYDFAFVEASSHALVQNRFNGVQFEYSIWTSFSQDHLDYHKTMDSYFSAKQKILDYTQNKVIISSLDQDIISKLDVSKVIQAPNKMSLDNRYFKISYNLKNLNLALVLSSQFGVHFEKNEIEDLKPTPGRFNLLEKDECIVVIDFAHTPDALANIGWELRKMNKHLVTVMGCGGDRDRGKRSLMGKVCEDFSDFVYVTSDNPRTEDPLQILNDIKKGFCRSNHLICKDRKQAIRDAIMNNKTSIILIAGKGHENYIDENGTRRFYNDEDEVKKAFNDLF